MIVACQDFQVTAKIPQNIIIARKFVAISSALENLCCCVYRGGEVDADDLRGAIDLIDGNGVETGNSEGSGKG